MEAIRRKYAPGKSSDSTDEIDTSASRHQIINISGKDVEEVGFDKISRKLADLNALQIVILDHMSIGQDNPTEAPSTDLGIICPKVIQLDLSYNLLETWDHVAAILAQTPKLSLLDLSGNRFKTCPASSPYPEQACLPNLSTLSMDDCLMGWSNVRQPLCYLHYCHGNPALTSSQIARCTKWLAPGLRSLSARSNQLQKLGIESLPSTLKSLDLESNEFLSLHDLHAMFHLGQLESLGLRNNCLSQTAPRSQEGLVFPSSISHVDLSNNKIADWLFVDELARIFPGLTSLRLSGNPLYDSLESADGSKLTADDGYMLTLARIAGLKTLNYSLVSDGTRVVCFVC